MRVQSAARAQRREKFIPPAGSQGKVQRCQRSLRGAEQMTKKAFCSAWRAVKGKLLF